MRKRGPAPCKSGTVLLLFPKSPAAPCRSKPTEEQAAEDAQELLLTHRRAGAGGKTEEGKEPIAGKGRKEREVMGRRAGAHAGVTCLLLPLQQPWLQQCLLLLPWAPVHPATRPSLGKSAEVSLYRRDLSHTIKLISAFPPSFPFYKPTNSGTLIAINGYLFPLICSWGTSASGHLASGSGKLSWQLTAFYTCNLARKEPVQDDKGLHLLLQNWCTSSDVCHLPKCSHVKRKQNFSAVHHLVIQVFFHWHAWFTVTAFRDHWKFQWRMKGQFSRTNIEDQFPFALPPGNGHQICCSLLV